MYGKLVRIRFSNTDIRMDALECFKRLR